MTKYVAICVSYEDYQFCMDHIVAADETEAMLLFERMRPHDAGYGDHEIWSEQTIKNIWARCDEMSEERIRQHMNEMIECYEDCEDIADSIL